MILGGNDKLTFRLPKNACVTSTIKLLLNSKSKKLPASNSSSALLILDDDQGWIDYTWEYEQSKTVVLA